MSYDSVLADERTPAPIKSEANSRRYLFNTLGISMLWVCGAITIVILLVIVGYILWNGMGVISLDFLTKNPSSMGKAGGIYPMILGTVYMTAIAVLVCTPLSVGAAIYMAEYAGENSLTKLVRFGADSLAGIPSIMFGMFGYLFFVLYLHMGFSLLAGGLTLALMGLPIVLRVSEEAIKTVPDPYRLGSMALGASKWQTIYKVVLPTAFPGIITGDHCSGMGRAIGETAAVMFTRHGGEGALGYILLGAHDDAAHLSPHHGEHFDEERVRHGSRSHHHDPGDHRRQQYPYQKIPGEARR